jgi:SNF2 family DNA or RNA helicase
MKSLANYGFGGILADDMGLGKTLQVLTLILLDKTEKAAPSLVIAPTSLLYNWQEEAAKFAPDLRVIVISGQQAERQERLLDIGQADLVVTSYGLIKRDIELYAQYRFKYCFLDEAQNVKNPNTMNAKSVKQIKAGSYFALTGTPIENTLTELWSIFDFIMPGYLRTNKQFTSQFETPIVKNGDQSALRELNRHIKPFILRRMKKTVLKELPEKIESKMTCEMTDEQAKLYGAWLLQAQAEFEQELAVNGFARSQIKILSLLTRLRQICCHPSLFLENYQGGSGKLEMLQEILKDAIDGGHRILLFSQFTSMLGMIQQQLDAMQIPYHYLDGSTKAEERIRLVHSFNSGEKAVFLISLKAGGTGLNLTGADMVIHFDPWWNPAVEDQATDRAYRIGQKNSVQVYKLITRNTIEDKIYTLQQKKKEMIDALIKPGENFLTKMSEDEIRELFRQ